MSIFRRIHALTEIGAMVAQSWAAVVQTRIAKTDDDKDKRIASLEKELARLSKPKAKR